MSMPSCLTEWVLSSAFLVLKIGIILDGINKTCMVDARRCPTMYPKWYAQHRAYLSRSHPTLVLMLGAAEADFTTVF